MNRLLPYLLSLVALLFLGSCASKKGGIKSGSRHEGLRVEKEVDFHLLTRLQRDIIEEAMTWMGTPYGYGRSDKGEATDCSGMVLVVYRDIAGVMLPRNSSQQASFSKRIEGHEVKAGDLVFFATGKDENRISHVGIMIDDDRFIHASSSKGVVISNVSSPYYTRTLRQFGRVLTNFQLAVN